MKKLSVIAALSSLLFVGAAASAASHAHDDPTGPTGAHIQGAAPTCSVDSTGAVTCTSFTIAGVGNTNATATLEADYSAIVDCRNPGGHIVESHSQTETVTVPTNTLQPKNGKLTVPQLTASTPTAAQFEALATCPNPNWTPEIRSGTITLTSFTYTVQFVGFPQPFITITGP